MSASVRLSQLSATQLHAYRSRPDVSRPELPSGWSRGVAPKAASLFRPEGDTPSKQMISVWQHYAETGKPAPYLPYLGWLLDLDQNTTRRVIARLLVLGQIRLEKGPTGGSKPTEYAVCLVATEQVVRTPGMPDAIRP